MDQDERGDDELIADIAMSADAFDAFYRRHVAGVVRFLAGRCRSPEDVADATATTFLAVLDSCSTYHPELGSGASWLYAIAKHEARGQARGRGRDASLMLRLQGRRLLSADDTDRIAEMIDAERATARLRPALDAARPSERELLDRLVADDSTAAEASRALGIEPGAGRLRLSRLRNTVRTRADLAGNPCALGENPAARQQEEL